MGFNYEEYQNKQLKDLGLDPERLTQAQKDIVLEPSDAPENYACDGEITPAEALRRWKRRMREAGFGEFHLKQLTRKIIG